MPLGKNRDATGGNGPAGEKSLKWLEERVRHLEGRLARHEPQARLLLDEWLNGPQRVLSDEAVQSSIERLLAVCKEKGVEAVLPEVCTCRELLLALADACHQLGLTSAGQYLHYL